MKRYLDSKIINFKKSNCIYWAYNKILKNLKNKFWVWLNPIRFSKILIVDDSKFFRVSIKKTLSDAKVGSIYYEAKDGKEAITQYIAHKPNIVIMDIVMPNVDGVKATQAITKYDPNAKIIVISSRENKETIDDVVNSGGAKDYVLKPVDSGKIIMAVSKQLTTNR